MFLDPGHRFAPLVFAALLDVAFSESGESRRERTERITGLIVKVVFERVANDGIQLQMMITFISHILQSGQWRISAREQIL